ncbi:DNA methyltransferase [Chlorobaculum sp. MV4-Y]|uniref:DNA methyltransferase n=1 Tax=Chlorobaculum sp. MV4-Y TaxID=2976335 RepID=UPI0039837AC3
MLDTQTAFDTPKPTRLIKRILEIATGKDSLVLDSFAGSGTTGQAVLTLNKQDGGNRRFILAEMDPNISRNVTAQRLTRCISGYKNVESLGGGFRFCELGEALFDADGFINRNVSFRELAQHIFFIATGQPLPAEAELTTPLIGVSNGAAVYLLYNGILGDASDDGGNVLTREVLSRLPAHEGLKIVYGNGCLLSPMRLASENIVFRQIPYEVRQS